MNEKSLKVLHLEDNELDGDLVQATLQHEQINVAVRRVATRAEFESAMRSGDFDLILSDFSLPGFDGLSALAMSRQMKPDVPFIFISGTIGEDRAVESLKNGAADYVLKDRLQRLGSAIVRARNDAKQRREQAENLDQIRRQAQLLNQAKDAIFIRNLDQEITYWNKSAERIYGWTCEEVIGERASDILYKQGAEGREQIWSAVLEKGEWTGEVVQVTKSGKEIVVSSHRTLLCNSGGIPIGVLNINTDITKKKELEAQVLRSQRMDSIGALAGGIAHDLNNMLAPILMVTELLQSELTDADQLRMLNSASTSARRGAALVKQILQFARGSKTAIGPVDLKSLVDELVRFISKTFPPSIAIEVETSPELLQVAGDATQLHQILLNLCVNARDAMEQGGVLSIKLKNTDPFEGGFPTAETTRVGKFIECSVGDTGSGIPPEILDRIFDPFFTTKKEGKGTGLGLSTVSTIVKNHKGFLTVESSANKGTAFRVFLPALQTNVEAPLDPIQTAVPMGRGEWILVVDDEFALLEMTKGLLEANNYNVLAARNGAEGLRLFDQHHDKIAVVVTDLLMPELGGEELIAQVSDRLPEMPTICLSGSAEETSVFRKGQKGPTAFLRKPCAPGTLLAALQKILRDSRPR